MANQLTLIEQRIAQRARALNSSAIRDILKLTESPRMISFAGGIPSPAAFPLGAPREAAARVMRDALALHMPDCVRWNVPAGGMFIWLELPDYTDSAALFAGAIAENVAFVPGAPFFAGKPMHH